ncbi:MAG: 5,10-methylenetetrahydromethanopterin reductase [Gammaproteobacteria bacterium]|jgi:5,10-methylenetetrahydromethanopterin reductase
MKPVGIAISGGLTASEIVRAAQLAESLEYESVWVAEGHGGDQFAILAACAMATSRVRLGTSITSIFVRSAPTIAMAAASIDDLSQGRFILGVGSSHKVQVEPEHGVTYGKPMQRTRETVAIIRALIADGVVEHHGETINIENFDLWFEPHRRHIPIYVSAVFPKMTELCGEISDGIILTRSTLSTAPEVRERLHAGATRAGRDANKIAVTSLLPTSVGENRAQALARMRPGLAFYAGFFPRYNQLIANHGFVEEAARVREAWLAGDRERAEAAVTDAMIDATSVAGTPEQCQLRIEAYRDSGIELPIISPFARGPGAYDVFERAIRACAPTE